RGPAGGSGAAASLTFERLAPAAAAGGTQGMVHVLRQALVKAQLPELRLEPVREVRLDGEPALELASTFRVDAGGRLALRQRQIAVLKGGVPWIVSLTTATTDADPALERALGSVRLPPG